MLKKKKKAPKRRYVARKERSERTRGEKIRSFLIGAAMVATVFALLFFLVLRSSDGGISIAQNGIGSLFTSIQSGAANVASDVKRFVQNWRNYDKLQSDYDELSRKNLQLSLELSSAEEAMQENERLQSLLNVQSAYESLDPIYARVIARDAGQWYSTFAINRGDSSGVNVGMAVVNEDGLIGRVYEVGLNYAKVITIVDPRSGLSCLIQRTRDNGILRGGVSDSNDNAECYIYYLPNLNNIVPGDTVVTSGTDETYPKGLKIGVVTELSLNAGSEGNYAVVSPSVDFLHIEEVLVLRTVVESTSGALSALPTPTPAPTATPAPTQEGGPTVDPAATEGIFTYPTANPENGNSAAGHLEQLPEDDWAGGN